MRLKVTQWLLGLLEVVHQGAIRVELVVHSSGNFVVMRRAWGEGELVGR
jgi:hypothetical protein